MRVSVLLIALLVLGRQTAPAWADDTVMAVSPQHKAKVIADGGAKWCGPHLTLHMVLADGSPDIGRPAAQLDLINRLRTLINSGCASAADASLDVVAGGKSQASYQASKSGGWVFRASSAQASVPQPASLDDLPPAAAPAAPPVQATPKPAAATLPGDFPGSHDPAFLKRYEGSVIVFAMSRSYDEYPFFVPNAAKPGEAIAETREGAVTRLYYEVPAGHTALELFRNYEGAVRDAGLSVAFEFLPCKPDWGNGTARSLFAAVKSTGLSADPFVQQGGSYVFAPTRGSFCFFTAKGTKDGQDVALTIAVTEIKNDFDKEITGPKGMKPIKPKEDEILVQVDMVSAKAMEVKMVTVKASDLADELATKGNAEIYGILFDTDKADIKPESTRTLDEIASLLKIDRSLRLEISGHTDNTGSSDHNRTLSEARAQAVVTALVKTYGIDPARLQARGYGDTRPVADNASDDGKSKNRRVELSKL